MLLNCGVGEDSWESPGLQGDPTSHSKGNQSWIFIGKTDAEPEAPILWTPDVKSPLIRKDPDAGKDWRQEEKGTTEDEMIWWHHWLNAHENYLQEIVKDREAWHLAVHGVGHDWAIEHHQCWGNRQYPHLSDLKLASNFCVILGKDQIVSSSVTVGCSSCRVTTTQLRHLPWSYHRLCVT